MADERLQEFGISPTYPISILSFSSEEKKPQIIKIENYYCIGKTDSEKVGQEKTEERNLIGGDWECPKTEISF